jgi:hypothetical protein
MSERRKIASQNQEKNCDTGNIAGTTVSFRLFNPYYQKLEKAALAARITSHQMARQLLVATLENPSKEELVQDLYEIGGNIEFLLTETRELRREVASLKISLAASVELLLTTVGAISPDDARTVVDDLFEGEGM